jgi:hypothetical protein
LLSRIVENYQIAGRQSPRHIVDRITGFKAPMKWLAREALDELVFEQDGEGRTVLRATPYTR